MNGRPIPALIFVLGLLAFLMGPLGPTWALGTEGRRLALVIGNSAYDSIQPLKNATADAELVAETLSALGFDVTLLRNAGLGEMKAAMETIKREGARAEAVLFYYSGHGFQLDGRNYLVPTGAALTDRQRIEAETIQLDNVMAELADGLRPTIIMLDACRNNPLPASVRGKDAQNGLAQVNANKANTYILFSTGPGNISYDGTGDNGPFALALQAKLTLPDQDFVGVMKRVRKDVSDRTGGLQLPWEQSSMLDDFQFNVGLAPGRLVEGMGGQPEIQVADTGPGIQLIDEPPLGLLPGGGPLPPCPPSANGVAVVSGGLRIEGVPDDLARGTQIVPSTPPAEAEGPAAPCAEALAPEPEPTPAVPDTPPAPTTTVATLTPDTRLAPIEEGTSPPAEEATTPVPPVEPPAEPALSETEVAALVQTELKRIGCYSGTLDGDWGSGSRKALQRYFEAKKLPSTGSEPTLELKTALAAETGTVCVAQPPATTTKKKQPTVAAGTETTKTTQPQEPAEPKPKGGLKITAGSGSFR